MSRKIMRLELTPEAAATLKKACKGMGRTQKATLSRMVEGFAGLPVEVQELWLSAGAVDAKVELAGTLLGYLVRLAEAKAAGDFKAMSL